MGLVQTVGLAGQCGYKDCRADTRGVSVYVCSLYYHCIVLYYCTVLTLAFEGAGESVYELWYYFVSLKLLQKDSLKFEVYHTSSMSSPFPNSD